MYAHRHVRTVIKLVALAAPLTMSSESRCDTPPDAKRECMEAYVSAQEYRNSGNLLQARTSLWACATATCPAIIQSDCTTWLNQVVESIPSVVLEARVDDENVFDVSVSLDGTPLARELDGKPIEVNPGLHTFVFERAGAQPIGKKLIIAAHTHSQVVNAVWISPRPAPSTPRPVNGVGKETSLPVVSAPPRPVPTLTYVLGGVAVAAFGTFALLGATGKQTQSDLESSCSPHCAPGDVSTLKTRFIAADVAAGVGALAASGALIVYLGRPERRGHGAAASAVSLAPLEGGAALEWSGRFSY